EVVEVRKSEAERAMDIVAAKTHQLDVDNLKMSPSVEDVEAIADFVAQIKPDVILLPWLFDAVAKHRCASHLLYLAHKVKPLAAMEIWGYQAHNALFHNGYVDITDKIEVKQQMLQCYESQNRNYKAFGHLTVGMAAWNSRYLPSEVGQVEKRYAELFFTLPTMDFMTLVERHYLKSLDKVYKGHPAIVRSMSELQDAIIEKYAE
ncbi:MAG: hypothetical protein U9N38_05715, partial [Thermodesulfobacteriota bacterium]|nr:hypothetical protein [Thermodesulfobacteriota bacterium]